MKMSSRRSARCGGLIWRVVAQHGPPDVEPPAGQGEHGLGVGFAFSAVRSTRSALPMLPLVGFSGPPPEPGVPVTEHRALHKSLRAERMSSCRGGPWRGDGCAAVSVARDASACLWWLRTAATVSGPRNSMATAVPRGCV